MTPWTTADQAPLSVGFIRIVQIIQINNVIHHMNRMKDSSYRIVTRDAQKVLDKIQHPFMI